jgi:hypothetical protein
MDEYTPVYCGRCCQLQWQDFRGKPCQFCGNTEFAPIRPEPTFTQYDHRKLKDLRIPTVTKKKGPDA